MRYITGFLMFWYDFIIGDAWEVALGVVIGLAIFGFLAHSSAQASMIAGPLFFVAIMALLTASVWREAHR